MKYTHFELKNMITQERGKPISYSSDRIATFQPMVYKVGVINTYHSAVARDNVLDNF